jgi:cell division protein FtsL
VVYISARLGVFAAVLTVFMLIGFGWLYSTLIAAALSLAFSLIFLSKQREALSSDIYSRVKKTKDVGIDDSDSDLENDLLDLK